MATSHAAQAPDPRAKQLVRFERLEQAKGRVTHKWVVHSVMSDDYLGQVEWFSPWRRYVFGPASATLYDAKCLRAIADFCEKETKVHKSLRAAEMGE